MRSKEQAHDYRYFPDPDLVPVIVDEAWVDETRKTIPELPEQKRERFVTEYGLPEYDAGVLTSSRSLADYFEKCASLFSKPKIISNWIMGDLLRELNKTHQDIDECPISPDALVNLLKLIDEGVISGNIAKTVFEEMYQTQKEPLAIVEEKGLKQITDDKAIDEMVEGVLQANLDQVEEYKNGKEKVLGFLVGQVMKVSKGKANPGAVNKMLKEKMSGM
jgi:aspartyl-tRNA(Asn)/glutamyl-tRNA(Gln) amidotransferase subunit B